MIYAVIYFLGYIITSGVGALFNDPIDDGMYFFLCAIWPVVWLFWFFTLITVGPYRLVHAWWNKPVKVDTVEIGEAIIAMPVGGLMPVEGIYLGNDRMATIYTKCKIDTDTIKIKNKYRLTKLGKLLYKKTES